MCELMKTSEATLYQAAEDVSAELAYPTYDLCNTRYLSSHRQLALAVVSGTTLDILTAIHAGYIWELALIRGADDEENDTMIEKLERELALLERYLATDLATVSTGGPPGPHGAARGVAHHEGPR